MARPGEARCQAHLRARNLDHHARRNSRPGDGAARRLRRHLNRDGWGECGTCRREYPASDLEVDHRVALADGGTDYASNVWALCTPHHRAKSAEERRSRLRSSST
jgi:5-methylcytosine-specific restriction endonuclease McrA